MHAVAAVWELSIDHGKLQQLSTAPALVKPPKWLLCAAGTPPFGKELVVSRLGPGLVGFSRGPTMYKPQPYNVLNMAEGEHNRL
jgi:hypothetical protein